MSQPLGTIQAAGDAVQIPALLSAFVRLSGPGASGTVAFEVAEDANSPAWDAAPAQNLTTLAVAATASFVGTPAAFLVSTLGQALVHVKAVSALGAPVSVWIHPLMVPAVFAAGGGGAVSVTSDAPPGGSAWGQVVGTTASQGLAAAATRAVMVKADDDNTGSVYVGFANTVTADKGTATSGTRLKATQSVTVAIANANLLWFRADAVGQNISLMAV